ncbi:hypothetical protein [uncultured Rubinisphaera sp.]|uniref:hypothetical protein n=1 Tax=uncultured Rubinisphaera sp. TaxID=1678686 RepID=UPI0030D849E4
MKVMIFTVSVLLIAVAAVTGIVLAQIPSDNSSLQRTNDCIIHTKSTDDGEHPVLGRVLFENVTHVHFCGVSFPANPDGSFGGWVLADDEGTHSKMTIYENYIVQDHLRADGIVFRECRPYDKLGNIEQQIPRRIAGSEAPADSPKP